MKEIQRPVGVFDSGVGGVSVLKKLTERMPDELFLYFGDNANAPYGTKTEEEVRALSFAAVGALLRDGCKAIVIACNTATAAAAKELREKYRDIPIVGMEPAVKPAALSAEHPKVLILATPMTLRLEKLHALRDTLADEADFSAVGLPRLVEFTEEGRQNGKECEEYLRAELSGALSDAPDAVVLGCTHFPFALPTLRKIFPENTAFFDGSLGTARQLERLLNEKGLKSRSSGSGGVIFRSSDRSGEKVALMRRLFLSAEETCAQI